MATYNTLKNGSSGSDVKKLQQALVDAGYSVGSAGVDGIYGSDTASAVRKYQTDNKLYVDGIAGNETLGYLYTPKNAGTAAGTPDLEKPTPVPETKPAGGQERPNADLSQFTYDPAADTAYQQALQALQQAQQALPTYQGKYDQQLQDIYNQIVNRDKFSYDLNADALYQQYKDQYVQLGQMAMQDTMGQAAALTGGYGNSYAQGVGQQAYQGYLQQLNGKVPELYGMALDQYNREGQDLMNRYAMVGDMRDEEYGHYMDALNQYWQNVSFAKQQADTAYNQGYGASRDQAADKQWEESFAYQKEQDRLAQENWQKEYDEAIRQYNQQFEAAHKGASGGGGGNPGGLTYDSQVAETQKMLNDAGYNVTVDGIMGPETQKALEEYIKENDNPGDGDDGVSSDDGGQVELSDSGKSFMKKLPYLNSQGDPQAWKKYVDKQIDKAYQSGALSEDDVKIILRKLGIGK